LVFGIPELAPQPNRQVNKVSAAMDCTPLLNTDTTRIGPLARGGTSRAILGTY
jgi:hypothetical protein